jgi:3-oxoacyl-[acyl-carrier-protein] synthase-1
MHPAYLDREWNPVRAAMAQFLNTELPNLQRFLKLGLAALEEAVAPLLKIQLRVKTIPLLVNLPEPRDGLSTDLQQRFTGSLQQQIWAHKLTLLPEFYGDGHAGGLIALKAALLKLNNGEAEFCLVGGLESYINLATLRWLENSERLKCTWNKAGLIPGEAAGFCLVTTSVIAQHYNLKPLATIMAVADAKETTANAPNGVSIGQGLSRALSAVLAALPEDKRVQQIYCDFNGQRQRVDEYGYAMLRLSSRFENPAAFIAPANKWGDLGAASAPLLISLVTEAARKGYAKGEHHLVFASSLGAQRAALLLTTNQPTKPHT